MTSPRPARYDIKELLARGVQPWHDFDGDEMKLFASPIKKGQELLIPIVLSTDGILLEGHQRLRLLLQRGTKTISAADVRTDETATAANALERAVTLNSNRRDTTAERAAVARKLQREYHWSQAKIAKLMGVSRPAVSQWFARDDHRGGDQSPVLVEGADGRMYDRDAVSRRPPTRPQRPPWHPDGYAHKGVRKALHLLQGEPYGGLAPLQEAKLAQLLADLIEAAEALQNQITDA